MVLVYLIAVHAMALVGLVLFPLPGWRNLAIFVSLMIVGGLGTSVCYHRALSHRAVRLNPVVEHILIFFTVFNGSGSPLSWVANHRHHHSKSDTAEDVSSPRHGGFWWAHLRWIYQWSGSPVSRWCPDLNKPQYRFWERVQIPVIILSLCVGGVFGWQAFFWLGAIRLVYALHLQMTVNSLLHMTPGLPEGEDTSRNLWWLGPLQFGAWGENWHRNHHYDQNAANFARRWWQVDVGYYFIRALKSVGLASNVKPPKEEIKRQRQQAAA
jgi:stearoyl-CoA desaturase (delta-9 desaturase)